ncbi:MAG: biopolymer transporter ExbD [Gemmatimonadetes bacterium]|nr:biopolymer transporter ExbD [Gemmatimonadota bacterium]MYI07396.1 biopolymer transporter ExbD [Gemmatimonadota bacterium]
MRKRGVERSPLPVRAEINVTSLVDVAFTLLVIFIITAPVMQGGIEVNLPRGQVGYIEASDKLLDVTVRPPDSIFFGELPVTRDEAPAALRQLIRARDLEVVALRGDSLAHYGIIATLLDVVDSEGVTPVLILEEVIR